MLCGMSSQPRSCWTMREHRTVKNPRTKLSEYCSFHVSVNFDHFFLTGMENTFAKSTAAYRVPEAYQQIYSSHSIMTSTTTGISTTIFVWLQWCTLQFPHNPSGLCRGQTGKLNGDMKRPYLLLACPPTPSVINTAFDILSWLGGWGGI